MSLWFALKVNEHRIGVLTIQRVRGDSDPDSVNTYEVVASGATLPVRVVEVEHRYGDGAWELVRTALDAALDLEKMEQTDA